MSTSTTRKSGFVICMKLISCCNGFLSTLMSCSLNRLQLNPAKLDSSDVHLRGVISIVMLC